MVAGDVNGRLTEFFAKLTTIAAKQPFNSGIIAGNLFSDIDDSTGREDEEIRQLIAGGITIPFPVYFVLGTRPLPEKVVNQLQTHDGEICPNLTILGRKSTIRTTDGLNIVAVGGRFSPEHPPVGSPYDATFTEKDAYEAGGKLESADILVTSMWPEGIENHARSVFTGTRPLSLRCISELCATRKPRYHFSTSDAFYEREPFVHPEPTPDRFTRFISLAPFGNTNHQKWLYAFSIDPGTSAAQLSTSEYTPTPFTSSKKRRLESSSDSPGQIRFDEDRSCRQGRELADSRRRGRGGGRAIKRARRELTPRPCFFCLGNKDVEAHMICSIGEQIYMTVAKGPLIVRGHFPDLEIPAHLLLIPIEHEPTISSIKDELIRDATTREFERYRTALHGLLTSSTKDASGKSRFGTVTYEISRRNGVHVHWQLLAIPVDLVQRGLVEAAFDTEAENLDYPRFVKGAKAASVAESGEFLKVTIWSEASQTDLVLPIDMERYAFDVRFPRVVLAKLLGLEARSDWRNCSQVNAEEASDATAFKEAFKDFDFSL